MFGSCKRLPKKSENEEVRIHFLDKVRFLFVVLRNFVVLHGIFAR